MEANARQSRFLQQRLEPPVCRSRIHRQLRAGRLRENPLTDGDFLPRPQQRRDALRQDDRAVALARFRVAEGVNALSFAVQRPADFERPGLRVEVAPHERADLAAPQAGHKFGVEEIPPDIILLDSLQKRVQLLLVQHLHRLVVQLRRSCVLGRIFRNGVCLHRSLHRAVQHCVDVPEDQIAVCLVSYDDAPFPAPIAAFPDHPVPGWPPFSHIQDAFPSRHSFSNNYHAGDRIATPCAESYQKVIILVSFCRLCGLFTLRPATCFAII